MPHSTKNSGFTPFALQCSSQSLRSCTGDQFISRYDDLKKIIDNFPQGLAVDMESNAIAQVCYMYDTPFVSLRIVSDTPGINDHEQSYLNFWEEAPKTSFNAVRQRLENIK